MIVGNEAQIIRELSTHKPIVSSFTGAELPPAKEAETGPQLGDSDHASARPMWPKATRLTCWRLAGGPPCMAEREAIERVLTQTRWNRRQAAKILKISYKALLNKLKIIEEQNASQNKNLTA